MNCPNCGAENEPGARFCAECGTPLESQADQPVVVEQFPEEEDDSDRTILSSARVLAEEAKTVSVSQDQVEAAIAEASAPAAPEPEPVPVYGAPPPAGGGPAAGGGGGGMFTRRNIIIAVVVLLVLCCCCAILSGVVASQSGVLEEMNLGLIPALLALV